jgi:hypothetical protein
MAKCGLVTASKNDRHHLPFQELRDYLAERLLARLQGSFNSQISEIERRVPP